MRKSIGIAMGLIVALTGAAWAGLFSDSWRYKMTVVVETPEGVKTGSAVREVTVKRGLSLTPQMMPKVEVRGEAVVVDLGKRGALFALLQGYYLGADYAADISRYAFGIAGGENFSGKVGSQENGAVKLDPTWYPVLVHFQDKDDPKTVERVLELEPVKGVLPVKMEVKADHLQEMFGSGVNLKAVLVEKTNEPITLIIQKWLPWLSDYRNKMFDGQRYNTLNSSYPVANSLSAGAFSTEVEHER